MKKTMLTFAALATLATSFASARGAHMPAYNHANNSGEIAGLQAVQYDGMKRADKNDDSIKFSFPGNTVVAEDDGYQFLGRTESR
ncbi:hypothetical protein [Neisseria montereyensis]|uniref:Uncharacterized protein n=1 Tax=Neisseria montereyensis TaxID=2973938 RepID=A0ABT2FE19_9NEIS|nr:hypothetical protein [Neisseria montereyensis]MCS4534370.1 hypothetical protein [Neisseria montereyensis]